MHRMGAVVLGASALMAATVGSGWARRAAVPSADDASSVPPAVAESTAPQATPLFTIGGMTVYLWAPVEPAYNANMNRNSAGDPLWESEMPNAQ